MSFCHSVLLVVFLFSSFAMKNFQSPGAFVFGPDSNYVDAYPRILCSKDLSDIYLCKSCHSVSSFFRGSRLMINDRFCETFETLGYETEGMMCGIAIIYVCNWLTCCFGKKKGKKKVQGVPQSQTAALPTHQVEEETDKSKQAQIERTYEKH